ncbi:ImmA/IrrE family metallo-endopeptidase [Paenibacillus sp. GCM10023248]|uniref:ImmA/IrrE family metallo-endopeptidase n=1 Tax=Bacillales TaxID=1385 RepID=UPI00237911E1|nr:MULTISPECIES: ImmA/IrrE family metallo-endopeptidase [Bacillales]MDD9266493.1 ImmA/IrrE family metallo-endopeptidase [Paenibacillus sp. MAHUQ-63]MDR6878619.1 Zn-dependent peptidase ImmA (M78 family) [Bacillus sp. 3255]
MFTHYQTTPLEQWVEDLYEQYEITSPAQLCMSHLAAKLRIWVYTLDMNSMAIENNGQFSINVDRRLSPTEQWEDFLHELCHVLRHAGNQMVMPDRYVNWQEQDATAFQLYAALPLSMLKKLPLPEQKNEMIAYLSEEFHVTFRLAKARIDQIQRRVLQGLLDYEYQQYAQSRTSTYNPANWSDATCAIMAKLEQLKSKGAMSSGQANRLL